MCPIVSGAGSPGLSWIKGHKTVVVVVVIIIPYSYISVQILEADIIFVRMSSR